MTPGMVPGEITYKNKISHENKHNACGYRHTEWKYRGHFHVK